MKRTKFNGTSNQPSIPIKKVKKELWEIALDNFKRSVGKPRIFPTPEHMLRDCTEYFQWVKDNPLYETKAFAYQGMITQNKVPKMLVMTLTGLQLYVGITAQGWIDYRSKVEYLEVMEHIESCIYHQKFSGAAADLLNANIIARDLGLRDSKEITGKGGGPLSFSVTVGEDDNG